MALVRLRLAMTESELASLAVRQVALWAAIAGPLVVFIVVAAQAAVAEYGPCRRPVNGERSATISATPKA